MVAATAAIVAIVKTNFFILENPFVSIARRQTEPAQRGPVVAIRLRLRLRIARAIYVRGITVRAACPESPGDMQDQKTRAIAACASLWMRRK
jgi:hypothetical protein